MQQMSEGLRSEIPPCPSPENPQPRQACERREGEKFFGYSSNLIKQNSCRQGAQECREDGKPSGYHAKLIPLEKGFMSSHWIRAFRIWLMRERLYVQLPPHDTSEISRWRKTVSAVNMGMSSAKPPATLWHQRFMPERV